MKKYIIIVLTTMLCWSCADIDVTPLDAPTEDAYYLNYEQLDIGAMSAYSSYNKLYQANSSGAFPNWAPIFKVMMLPSDVIIPENIDTQEATVLGIAEYEALNFDPTLVPLTRIYGFIYEGIFRTNLILEKKEALLASGEITDAEALRIEAEMKFLRAFYHFQAVKFWGNPPLVTERINSLEDSAQPNATDDELYGQILSDFEDAFNGLPTRAEWGAANLGRATKWAAMAYIGKVNVWKKDWSAAVTAFEQVKNSGAFSLTADYADNFAADTENNSESIFELQFGDNPFESGNIWTLEGRIGRENRQAVQTSMRLYFTMLHRDAFAGRQYLVGGIDITMEGRSLYTSTEEFLNSFEVGDLRKGVTVYDEGDDYYTEQGDIFPYTLVDVTDDNGTTYDFTTGANIKKYLGERGITPEGTDNGRGHNNNERYYRYGEMLLLYAEALIEAGRPADAMNVINNDIRTRAGLGNTSITNPTEAMRFERKMELAFEGHRFFDIQRWGIGASVFGSSWNDRLNRYPYPSQEITKSGGKLQQNSGY